MIVRFWQILWAGAFGPCFSFQQTSLPDRPGRDIRKERAYARSGAVSQMAWADACFSKKQKSLFSKSDFSCIIKNVLCRNGSSKWAERSWICVKTFFFLVFRKINRQFFVFNIYSSKYFPNKGVLFSRAVSKADALACPFGFSYSAFGTHPQVRTVLCIILFVTRQPQYILDKRCIVPDKAGPNPT